MNEDKYGTPYDPGNIFSWGNLNISNTTHVNYEMYHFFVQDSKCLECPVTEEYQKRCPFECRFWNHDCRNEPKSLGGEPSPVIQTRSQPSWKYRISLSRAELVWNYNEKVPFILRTGGKFRLSMHHKNGNKLDDRYKNLVFRDDHSKLEGRISSFKSLVKKAEKVYKKENTPESKDLFYRLKKKLRDERKVGNSPIVEFIIKEQISKLNLQHKSLEDV